ncbi:MAG: type IV toxin-antitoxin system AbiEi family antitoxin domain-containing protein [Planctomycetaceae bacterium]|nr:type IV toxin-antitoxin system AbiEi family antitoxin domain-containing protein [Planctomycetaceae bacterium]
MEYRSNQQAELELRGVAEAQGGYFTSREAATAGYGYSHLTYHVGTGRFERVAHGTYRLSSVPVSPHDDLIRLSLWSRDSQDRPQAVASHVSALTVHGLTLLLPETTHLTVPAGFRKKPPTGCVLHRDELARADVEPREGFSVTTPLRALVDVALSLDVPQDELARAVNSALERGLVTRTALLKALQRVGVPTALLRRLRIARRTTR